MLNAHFRRALAMSIDRGTYNAQSVGEDLKFNCLINSYTPGTFVNLPEDATVEINGTATTFGAGTFYGEIMQAQLDADGVALKVWNGTSSSGFDGWYNVEAAQAELAAAVEELAAVGIEVSAEAPIYIDFPVRTGAAMLNQHFRLALAMSIDRGTYNAQSVGEDLKFNALVNSYTPGTFVNLPEEVTVDINGTATTFGAGTFYGEIMQAQMDADGIALTVWNGESSSGFDGWYNPEAAAAELAVAVEELAAVGIEVSAENPIYIDFPVRTDSEVNMNQKQAVKQSVEAATNGAIKINLIEYATRDTYLDATYWYNTGIDANFDLNDGSGWGPDFGDPSTYLGTMLPQYAGYMTKSLGIF